MKYLMEKATLLYLKLKINRKEDNDMNTEMKKKMQKVFEDTGIKFPEDEQFDLEKWGMDSVLLLNLIVNIEKEYGIKIPDEKLLYENFSSLSIIYNSVDMILEKENNTK